MSSRLRLWLLGTAIVVGTLIVLLVLAVAAFNCGSANRLEHALAALSAAGKPVLPEDLQPAQAGRASPASWLERLESDPPQPDAQEWLYPSLRAQLAAKVASGALGEELQQALRALEQCAGSDMDAVWEGLEAALGSRDAWTEIPPCAREALHVLVLSHGPLLAKAHEARELGPIDGPLLATGLDPSDADFPEPPPVCLFDLTRALSAAAYEAAWAEQPDRAVERIRAQRDIASLTESTPLLIAYLQWARKLRRLLGTLEFVLPRVAPDTELGDLDAWLAQLRPHEALVRALEGERTFGNRVFAQVRGDRHAAGEPRESFLVRMFLDHDQCRYLSEIASQIERARSPSWMRPPIDAGRWPDMRITPLSVLLVARPADETADVLQARVLLARAALAALRDGPQAARSLLEASIDPFDGKPLRFAIDGEGRMSFWSVGKDRIDDGAPDPDPVARDLVWRLKLR